MCISPLEASRRGGSTRCRGTRARESAIFAEIFIVRPGSLLEFAANGQASGFAMTRAGVGYVAMVAAGISAGALGYAVIWSYEPEAPPPVAMAVPPVAP